MKDSGIAWIGEIPEEWEIRKFNQLCSRITDFVASGSFASIREKVKYLDSPNYAMLVRTTDLAGTARSEGKVYISKESYDFLSNSNLFGGEIVLPNIGSIGDVYIVPNDLYPKMSLAPNSITFSTTQSDKYYYYYFQSPTGNMQLKEISESTAMPKFNKTDLRQLKVINPPLPEQRAIANYLDRKCGEIDELISLQEKMIEELKAYKQSVITEAVTKGLNPDVPMKDSGIEWIGKIPEGWRISQLKKHLTFQNGQDYKQIEASEYDGFPVYGSGGIFAYAERYIYEGESVLFGRKGTINKPLYVNGKFWTVDTMYYTIPQAGRCCKYMYYLATILPYEKYSTTTALPSMTQTILGNLIVAIPTYAEQQAIADYLDNKCSEIDSLIALKQKKIEELKEYKKSMIYEYVTGKKEM